MKKAVNKTVKKPMSVKGIPSKAVKSPMKMKKC
jgi:hypothetical protein